MKKVFKLCYVDDEKNCAYFTDNFEKQWGDDWDDVPYEHNAGRPYDSWNELVEEGDSIFTQKWEVHNINVKKVFFDLPTDYNVPRTGCLNSPYSVKDINNGVVAWIWTDDFKLFAETNLEEFIKVIQENGGTIYTELKKGE